jgi:hypothetical protein
VRERERGREKEVETERGINILKRYTRRKIYRDREKKRKR